MCIGTATAFCVHRVMLQQTAGSFVKGVQELISFLLIVRVGSSFVLRAYKS